MAWSPRSALKYSTVFLITHWKDTQTVELNIRQFFYLRHLLSSGKIRRAPTGLNHTPSYQTRHLVSILAYLWACGGSYINLCIAFWNKDINLEYCFPIICHGDDADHYRRQSFCCVTIASPLAPARSSWDTRMLIYVMDTTQAISETYDILDAWVVHGLSELQEGRYFDVDIHGKKWNRPHHIAGERICGEYIGVLVALKGDQKYLQRTLKLNTSGVSDRVCMYCCATSSSGDNLYTAFGPHAPHRSTLVSNTDFMLTGCRPNSWLRLPGFHVERVLCDWLHLVDLSLPEVSASDSRLNP